MKQKIKFSLILATATVLSISFVKMNCSKVLFYIIIPYLSMSSLSPTLFQNVFFANLLINVFVVALIYYGLLFKVKHIKKRYFVIAYSLMILACLNLFATTFFRGNYHFMDYRDRLQLQTDVANNEPFKTQISFFLNFDGFEKECEPFY